MSTIILPNIRVSSDLTVKLKLKDGGVALDWSTLQNIKVSIYSDAQRALAGRCGASIDAEDPTLLVCTYAANKPQYVGVNRVVVSAKYMGETKTYDKPAFNFVRWTDDQAGEQITIDDPDIDVEISVEDVSSSILQEAVDAAFTAADRANDAAEAAEHMVDIHTGPQGEKGDKGDTGEKGDTGDAAGFGTVSAALQEDGGDPSVVVAASGPDTAKQFDFTFKNLKGDKGDKGDQGNSGYQGAAGELEVVNNLTDGGSTAALSAEMGKTLKGEVSQLEAEVTDLKSTTLRPILTFGSEPLYFDISTLTSGKTYLIRVQFASENYRFVALSTEKTYASITQVIAPIQNFATGEYFFEMTPNGEHYLRIGDTNGNYGASSVFIYDEEVGATYYKEIDDLDKKFAIIPELSSSLQNKDENSVFEKYAISQRGAYSKNGNYRTIWFICEPNTTYKVSSPLGTILRIGSSVNAVTSPFQRFLIADGLTSAQYKTGEEDNRLYITFWVNTSSYSLGDTFQALSVARETARDIDARNNVQGILNSAVAKSKNLYNPAIHHMAKMNMPTTGVPTGTYNDRAMLGLIPVYGLSKISVALISPATASGSTRYCWYDKAKEPISPYAIGGSPTYGENNNVVLDVPEGAYYFACLVYYANMELDANGAPMAMIQEGDAYTGYVPYENTIVGVSNRPKDIYVVAKNSPRRYRFGADYYCTGTNDELTIQKALDAVGTMGTLYLAPGTYDIGAFHLQDDGQYCAIQYKLDPGSSPERRVKIKCFDQTPMRQNGYSQLRRCATLHITNSAYSALDSDTQYAVIGVETSGGGRVWNGNIFDCEGIAIEIPGNQKKVIAFDAYYAFCMMMFKCMATAIPNNAMPSTPGVDNCIGIRCTKGSNFGQESQINTCAMYGFGQGVAVMGEHYVLTNIKTIYNKYGFTFNWFGSADGGYSHPNTLINCCSEMDMNYPYFGQTNQGQSLTLIDFNMEHKAAAFALGGQRAKELIAGSWRGTIHYTIKVYQTDGYPITGNSESMPFWEDGYGKNMESVNDTQRKVVATVAALADFAPNFNQIVYVTELNKPIICTDPATSEWRDFTGAIVPLS